MSLDTNEVIKLIKVSIPNAEVDIRDTRGDGQHYAIYVVSSSFEGKTRIEQHQAVYKALEAIISDDDQAAFAVQTALPE